MFDDNYNDTAGRYELSSIDAIREAALIMYGRFISHMHGSSPEDEKSRTRHVYLSLQETENIVREHCDVFDDKTYAVGGDTPEEANKKINELMAALLDRVMSNVLQAGVRDGLIDCSYDSDSDDFTFAVTDKGKQVVREIRQDRENAHRSDIS